MLKIKLEATSISSKRQQSMYAGLVILAAEVADLSKLLELQA